MVYLRFENKHRDAGNVQNHRSREITSITYEAIFSGRNEKNHEIFVPSYLTWE